MTEPTGLLPFVPSGGDFDKSRALHRALGFEELYPEFASNLMIKLEVPDLDAWWAEISGLQLESRFAGFRIKGPTEVPWGREVTFIDLAGVCWHVGLP